MGNKLQRIQYIKMCKMPGRVLYFPSFFQIFSSSVALCPSTEIFKIQIPAFGKYFCISTSYLYLQLGGYCKGEQCHSTCVYEYCHLYFTRVYLLTENYIVQQTYKKAGPLVKNFRVTKERQRKAHNMLITAYTFNSN